MRKPTCSVARLAEPTPVQRLDHGTRQWLWRLLQQQQQADPAAGFSMAVVVIALLAVVLTTLAVVSRTTLGHLGSLFTSQNAESRGAAEAGITKLIADWNQVPNRMLLASGSAASTWLSTSQQLRNPCTATSNALASATPIGGPDLARYRSGDWINVVSADETRRYRLRRLTFKDQGRSRLKTVYTQASFGTDTNTAGYPVLSSGTSSSAVAPPFSLADPANSHGYLEVEMEGQVLRGGVVVATSRVIKEFQVVPKCCRNSFGRTLATSSHAAVVYGNDSRTCGLFSGLSPGDLALVTGLNGGGLTLDNGNAWTLRVVVDGTETKVDPILCTSPYANCDGTDANSSADAAPVEISSADGTIAVTPYNIVIPDPPLIPVSGFTMGPSDNTSIASLTARAIGNNSTLTLPAHGLTSNPRYCGYKDGAFHCRLSSIDLNGNNKITVDTTAAPVYLYLQDSPGSIDLLGGEGLEHRYNGALATSADALRFQIRGARRGGTPSIQTFDLSGNSIDTASFIWAPVASLTLGGSSQYRGLAWVNNLGFFGSTDVVIPTPNGAGACPENPPVSDVYCQLYGLLDTANGGATGIRGAFDWIARSVNLTKLY